MTQNVYSLTEKLIEYPTQIILFIDIVDLFLFQHVHYI